MSSLPLTVRVARKSCESERVCVLELVAADGGDLPAFEAGAHIDVQTPGGPLRQYSLCNDPAERHRYLIGVLREAASRGGSLALHERVQAGKALQISLPRNRFALHEQASYSLLLAGGIGITPLLCMAERLAQLRGGFALHYCVRSRAGAAFLDRIARSCYAARLHLHCDDGPREQQLQLEALLASPLPGSHLYVCGPAGFMQHVLGAARAACWPEQSLHCEYFSASAPSAPSGASARGFEVELARSGRRIAVAAECSVVEALARAGVPVEVSCEQGVCGTCLTRVLDGIPEHRDLWLSAAERERNDQFLPCCSRAISARLVLDL